MTKDPRPRRCRPSLERLEVRELLSAMAVQRDARPVMSQPRASTSWWPAKRPRIPAPGTVSLSNAVSPENPPRTPAWVNESFLQSLVGQLYGPITTTTPITVGNQTFPAGTYAVPQPTAREVRRETFWLEFQGTYTVGAPRFSNQSATIHIYSDGRSATSNRH